MHFSQYLLKKIQAVISYWNDQSFLYHSFYQTLKKSVRQIQHNYVHAHFAVHSYGLTTKSVSLMHVCACHPHHFSLALQWRTIFGFKKNNSNYWQTDATVNKTETETEGSRQWDDFRRSVSCNWRSVHVCFTYTNIAHIIHNINIY